MQFHVGKQYAFAQNQSIVKVDVTSVSQFESGLAVICGDTATHHVVMRAEGTKLVIVKEFALGECDGAIKYIIKLARVHAKLAA